MKEEDIQLIKTILNQTLDERDSIDLQTHRKHHDHIDYLSEEGNTRRARHEAVRRQVMGWGAVTLLTAIGVFFYNVVVRVFPGT